MMRIGIVAGEVSGDLLGEGVIHALRAIYPDACIEGIGGLRMKAAGFNSLYPLETLSVMGLVEVFKHYRRIKRCHDDLLQYFLQHRPDVFIGIDAPDFNLSLERGLKRAGIFTAHYVSPSVWAWRKYRLRKIVQACDVMLTLFPFEAEYYKQHTVPVEWVGHPLADQIPLAVSKQAARQQLNLANDSTWIALLPGSRVNEVNALLKIFLQTAHWLTAQRQDLQFIIPIAHPQLRPLVIRQINELNITLPLTLVDGQSQPAMTAADVVLTASGTATLEAMLLKRPMVVAYRMAELTYLLAKLLVYIPFFSLPNLLAQEEKIPEFLQHQVTPEKLGTAILTWLDHPDRVKDLEHYFNQLHQQLRQSASQKVVEAILAHHPSHNRLGRK